MKKFYSLVLMATALLIGTNAWAKTFTGTTASELQDAIYAIMNGTESDPVIKLSQPVDLERTVWVGTQNEADAYKSVTIDLNGNNIKMTGSGPHVVMFALTHGELKVINDGATEAKVELAGTTGDNSRIFAVFGSYRGSRWNSDGNAIEKTGTNTRNQGWFSHLEIGENVLLYAGSNCLVEAIAIASEGKAKYYKNATDQVTLSYSSNIFSNSWGYAHGVRVDFKGKIDLQNAASTGKVYGFSVKGTIRSALSASNTKEKDPETISDPSNGNNYVANYYNSNNGEVTNENQATHKLDTLDAPFIYISPEAEIKVRADGKKVAAIYAAGYAKWLIKGYAAGKTGVYISSGTLDFTDAYIKSTADSYDETSGIGSANGGGSGVVLNSRDNYGGDMDVTISGDTKIESVKGYAIEEAVNTTVVVPNPKADPSNPEYEEGADPYVQKTGVSDITIEGGTISGGDKGAIVISGPTDAATAGDPENPNTSTVVVYGGNVTGSTTVGADGDLDNLTPSTVHTTEVVIGGKTTIVVSEGGDPDAGDPITGNMVSNQSTDASVKWTVNTKDTIKTDLKLAELEINTTGLAQELVIKENATLTVGRVVLGKDARIIVEAGGKFIVTGAQGVVAPVASNIILKASNTAQGIFLFNPAVTSNRHPNATVEVYTNCYQLTQSPAKTYVRQRLAIPVMETGKPVNNFSGDVFPGSGASFSTYAWTWDGYKWAAITGWNQLKPFIGYTFSNNSQAAGVTYSFAGELVGNGDAEYNFPTGGFDYFGCSHVAPIYLDSLFKHFASDMEAAVWIYDFDAHQYNTITAEDLKEFPDVTEIKPMEAFVLNLHAASGKSGMDYASAVWGNPRFDAAIGRPSQKNPAPARIRFNDASNRAIVNITAENGYRDQVKLIEKDQYTAEFENGADANKLMFADGINLYATTEAGELARVATDDLKGTLLSFRAGNSAEYTITLTSVLGEDYALRDNVTGQVIAFAEGATYTFMQEANTTVPARFEVIAIAEVATAIENVEEAAKATGIYTITGQYVGRDFTNLPAGAYIVNGVKVIK